jgi:hypothetical protein
MGIGTSPLAMRTVTVEEYRGDCLDACDLNRRLDLLHNATIELDAGLKFPRVERIIVDRRNIQIILRSGRQQLIPISWTRCLGGYRPWVHCPQCELRFARLYYVGHYVCRCCAGITYRCRTVSTTKRLKARQAAVYRQLGYKVTPHRIRKPKWQRWPTFYRLRAIEQRLIAKLNERGSRHIARPVWMIP